MSLIDFVVEFLPSEDVIDLQLILTDMRDVYIDEFEREEMSYYDSNASLVANGGRGDRQGRPIPTAKQVW